MDFATYAQNFEKITLKKIDEHNLYVNDEDANSLHYYIQYPKEKVKGAVILMPASGETTEAVIQQISLNEKTYGNNIAIIIPSINWGTDDRVPEIDVLNTIFKNLVEQKQFPKNNFVLGGLSNGGIIALTYVQKSIQNPEQTYLKPAGILAIDTPLDKIRLYQYCEREINRNFSEAGMAEAKWMLDYYQNLYGGTPTQVPEKYIESSIYSFGVKNGGNALYFKNMPILMFSDLDTDWLINERHRDIYDWNGIDIVAFINQLKLLGNNNANVIISQGKGFRLDGSKHPHSWSIMDTNKSFDWLKELFKN